jgi:hypothetical protein
VRHIVAIARPAQADARRRGSLGGRTAHAASASVWRIPMAAELPRSTVVATMVTAGQTAVQH